LKSYDDLGDLINEFSKLLGRMLVFPLPTVSHLVIPDIKIAVINGICMAGGFTFALAHDYRFMTTDDKGFVCLNEVDMGTNLPHAMNACAK
jgi:Delta3-Delta2-enoyl-CoA isomerase